VVHAGCQEQSADLYKQIIAVIGRSEAVTITFSYISLTNQIARNEWTVFYTVWTVQVHDMLFQKLLAFDTRDVGLGLCIYIYIYLHFYIIPTLIAYFCHAIPTFYVFLFLCPYVNVSYS